MGGKWGDPSRPPGGNFLGFDGGLSRGSRVRGPGSEDPHRRARNFFYTVVYRYIESLNPRGQGPSKKSLEMRATQSSAANLTNASEIRKSKI